MAEQEKIEVPARVISALKEVRDEGRYNMFSSNDVVSRMSDMGHHSSFLWFIDMDRFERTGQVKVDNKKYMAGLEAMGKAVAKENEKGK